ncbi:MAG: response regulator transcription factor [Planctomycetota bacterium]
MRLLLICDLGDEATRLQAGLKKHGYAVDLATDAADAEERATTGDYDAILTKETEPSGLDALRVTRRLRNADVGEPLLVVPEEADEATTVEAFDSGADQVLDPERSFAELLSRVRGLLRQCAPMPGDTLRYLDIEMDLRRLSASRAGRPLGLVGKPYSVLEFFLRSPERVHSREAIGRSVWDENFDPFSNVIDVTVSKLRRELDKPFDKPYLHTVVGRGYLLGERPAVPDQWG